MEFQEGDSSSGMSVRSSEQERLIKAVDWYQGQLLGPNLTGLEDKKQKIYAIFNGPLFVVDGDKGTRFIIMPRVITRKQKPGVADHTGYFGVYEVFLDQKYQLRKLPPVNIAAIKGNRKAYSGNGPYNPEDIRITKVPDGLYAVGATAEKDGQPYPVRFLMQHVQDGMQVTSPMEIMTGLPPGKNVLMLDWYTALYRRETDANKIVITRQDSQTSQWGIIKEITFPPLKGVQGKTRIGLTGGERIPMANGNFRLIVHVVEHIPQPNTDYDIATYQFRLAEFRLDAQELPELVAVDSNPFLSYKDVIAVADPEGRVIPVDSHKAVIYSVGGASHQKGNTKSLLFPVTLEDIQIELFDIPFELLQQPFI